MMFERNGPGLFRRKEDRPLNETENGCRKKTREEEVSQKLKVREKRKKRKERKVVKSFASLFHVSFCCLLLVSSSSSESPSVLMSYLE